MSESPAAAIPPPRASARQRFKAALQRALRQGAVNAVLRAALRPLAGALPLSQLMRLPVVATVAVRLPSGAVLRLRSDGRDAIASALFWRGLEGWEPETFRVFDRLLPHADVVLDVGANSGLFALYAALERPGCRVFALEPVPGTHSALARNLALNGAGNVVACEAAACDHDGTIELFVPPGESLPLGASTLRDFREAGVRLPVRALRLDTLVREQGIARVDLVKLDTEGTEPAVLAGAGELLARDQPIIVCEVLHGLTEAGLHAALDPHGYRHFRITPGGPVERPRIVGDPAYRDRNWLFATPRRLAALAASGIAPFA